MPPRSPATAVPIGVNAVLPSARASRVTTLPGSALLFLMFRLPRTLLLSPASTRLSLTRIEIVLSFLTAACADPTGTATRAGMTATAASATSDFHLVLIKLHLFWRPGWTAYKW